MKCPDCKVEMILTDTTYCNYDSPKAQKGMHTGNIWTCSECNNDWLENFLTGVLEGWSYDLTLWLE